MGILVTGAEIIEEKVGRLRTNLKPVAEKIDTVNTRAKLAWEAVQKQTTLRNTQVQGRRMLKRIVESTIRELEKLSRKLETDVNIRGYAS